MVEVKGEEHSTSTFDSFFELGGGGDRGSMAAVLMAAERLSGLTDAIEQTFGGADYCKEVVDRARGLISAVYSMEDELYIVPAAQKMLRKYKVKLGAWARFKIAARFYMRPLIVAWSIVSLLCIVAAIALVGRLAIASVGVITGTVPFAALGYLAAVVAGICIPLATGLYMMKQIGFAFDRFVESVKLSRIAAYEYKIGEADALKEVLAPTYYGHSLSGYDNRNSHHLVRASSALLVIAVASFYVGLLLDIIPRATFFLGSTDMYAGIKGGSSLLWYDFAVIALACLVGSLLAYNAGHGSARFLHDNAVLRQLQRAYNECSTAVVKVRKKNKGTAGLPAESAAVSSELKPKVEEPLMSPAETATDLSSSVIKEVAFVDGGEELIEASSGDCFVVYENATRLAASAEHQENNKACEVADVVDLGDHEENAATDMHGEEQGAAAPDHVVESPEAVQLIAEEKAMEL